MMLKQNTLLMKNADGVRYSKNLCNLSFSFRLLLFSCLFLTSSVFAQTQDTTAARFLGDLLEYLSSSPPNAKAAMKLCESGKLPASGSTRVGSGTTSLSLDEFVLSRLSLNAEIINVLTCLVEKDVIEVNQTSDNGSKLLSTAAQRKHMRLASALLQRNATRPRNIISDAVSNRLLVLDITQKLLTKHKVTSKGGKIAPPEAAVTYAQWLAGLVTSMQKHLPSIEAKKPALALVSLLKNSEIVNASHSIDKATGSLKVTINSLETRKAKRKRDPSAASASGVALLETAEIEHVSMIANGLSALLVRVLLAGHHASTSDTATLMSMLSNVDRRGRTPLHRAAAVGNKIAAITMISTIVNSLKKSIGGGSSRSTILQDWVGLRDVSGHTSAQIACIYGHSAFATLLFKGGGGGGGGGLNSNSGGGDDDANLCKNLLSSITDNNTSSSSSLSSSTPTGGSASETGGWSGAGIGVTAAAGLRAVARNLRTRNNGIVPKGEIPTSDKYDDVEASNPSINYDFFAHFDHDCDTEVVNASDVTPSSFYRRFYSLNKPVVLRGLALDWPQRSLWKKDELLASNASKTLFLPSQIPYGQAFGDVGSGDQTSLPSLGKATLRDYILSLDSKSGELSGAPLYIFDSPIAASRGASIIDMTSEASQALIDDLEMVPPFLRHEIQGLKEIERVDDDRDDDDSNVSSVLTSDGETSSKKREESSDLRSAKVRAGLVLLHPAPSPQFYLGGPGTGSPLHFHKDAFNALIYGKKRWFLLPPSQALYSTLPVSSWAATTPLDGPGAPIGLKMCTQLAGDVMYVPHGWAHAVLNLETSVGVAVEFSSVLQE
jgi:hypothetical protein